MKINEYLNTIICDDCLETMRKMPDNSVDIVVTSPPYNLKNSTGNGMKKGSRGKWAGAALQDGYTHHNDCMPHNEYVKWQRDCLTEMMRLIKNTVAIFYNHKWRVQNDRQIFSTVERMQFIKQYRECIDAVLILKCGARARHFISYDGEILYDEGIDSVRLRNCTGRIHKPLS